MYKKTEGLKNLFEPVVTSLGYEFVGCELFHFDRTKKFRIFIDTPNGVDVDDCEKVSRQVSSILDVEDPIPGNYRLEVSSPGLDRPLFELKHFEQFVGEKVKLKTYEFIDERKNFTGKITSVEGQIIVITLVDDGQKVEIDFNNISRANIMPDYEAIAKEG